MASHSAFFYGTLMAPAVLHRVIHGSSKPQQWQKDLVKIQPAMLHRHQRHRVKGADYPAIIPSEDTESCVRGTFVQGLTDGDIWRLDIFEGDEYERRKVNIRLLEGQGMTAPSDAGEKETVEAETYIWIDGEDSLDKGEWDFDDFLKEKIHRWIGSEANDEYAEVDEAVKSDPNQDPTRGRGLNGTITRSLEEENGKAKEVLENAV